MAGRRTLLTKSWNTQLREEPHPLSDTGRGAPSPHSRILPFLKMAARASPRSKMASGRPRPLAAEWGGRAAAPGVAGVLAAGGGRGRGQARSHAGFHGEGRGKCQPRSEGEGRRGDTEGRNIPRARDGTRRWGGGVRWRPGRATRQRGDSSPGGTGLAPGASPCRAGGTGRPASPGPRQRARARATAPPDRVTRAGCAAGASAGFEAFRRGKGGDGSARPQHRGPPCSDGRHCWCLGPARLPDPGGEAWPPWLGP